MESVSIASVQSCPNFPLCVGSSDAMTLVSTHCLVHECGHSVFVSPQTQQPHPSQKHKQQGDSVISTMESPRMRELPFIGSPRIRTI